MENRQPVLTRLRPLLKSSMDRYDAITEKTLGPKVKPKLPGKDSTNESVASFKLVFTARRAWRSLM
jgi:hypothetical protein